MTDTASVFDTRNDKAFAREGELIDSARTIAAHFGIASADARPVSVDILAMFRRWYHYRKTVTELNRLDDRELADIGLERDKIHPTARQLADRYDHARPR